MPTASSLNHPGPPLPRIEDRIKDGKDCGLAKLPCGDFDRLARRPEPAT